MNRKIFAVATWALLCSSALCDDRAEIRDVLEANFQACNDRDIEALMDTCSEKMPDRAGFRRESQILFREKEIHYSLEDFRVVRLDGDYAEAWIVQSTYTEDRKSDSDQRSRFRNGTTLLPAEECVEYMAAFRHEHGKWKCLATISEPVPYRRVKAPN